MPIPFKPPSPRNINNPSKEIFASSGIYNSGILPDGPPFAPDLPNSTVANTGVASTLPPPLVVTTTLAPGHQFIPLSNMTPFVDDINVINNYLHYNLEKQFNPRSFLQNANITYRIYG